MQYKLINDIVKDMLEQHVGGEKFFDHLDEQMRSDNVAELLIKEVHKIGTSKYDRIVMSGKFGVFFYNYLNKIKNNKFKPLLVRGGLRHEQMNGELQYLKEDISGHRFLFIDDSFYRGNTRDAIKSEIERLGGELVETFVIYDGSKEKDNTVNSLYRFY